MMNFPRHLCGPLLAVCCLCTPAIAAGAPASADPPASDAATPEPIIVTASRRDLVGVASTASQGSVTRKEVELRPIYRVGQLYEAAGVVVTVHSGEGKANQYLMRGFNLDHGTDFASFVDAMPVNRPTNAHGQGYSDQNFLMPQVVDGLDYTKGPYYAAIGDFGAVGSAHVRLADDLPDQVAASLGTWHDENLFGSATRHFNGDSRLWAAIDLGHIDGPWTPPGDFRKINLATRFSHGTQDDGFSLTGMYYKSAGALATDQSIHALQQGLIGRYGTLDPTDASRSERHSLSGHYAARGDAWRFAANLYAIHATMTLWNDFTHYLFDQVNGDQEEQDEARATFGGDAAFTLVKPIGSILTETVIGVQERHDAEFIDRKHTHQRTALTYCDLAGTDGTYGIPYAAVGGNCDADHVRLNDLGFYIQSTTHWAPWLRSVLGLRQEFYGATDHSVTLGTAFSGTQTLLQPKGSLVLGPWARTELYLSAGRGFHSNDVRGVFETLPLEGIQSLGIRTPFMSPATGEEVGLRTNIVPKVQVQFAAFREDFTSELAYDQDQGEDQASAPSRRQGIEISAQYRPFAWIEINSDLAFARARYRGSPADLATYGLAGPYIANAPGFIGSFGVLIDNLGPWFGGLQWRDLGRYPVNDGAQYPEDNGYGEINLDAGYKLSPRLKFQVSVYNVADSHANAAAYYYSSRLTPTGDEVTGLQVHPLEPRSARVSLTATF
jgi:hypothetical protein